MDTVIPASNEVRVKLARLGHAQTLELSRISGVPFTTLWKIRTGETENPRLDTVRQFWPYVDAASSEQQQPQPSAAQE